MSPNLDFLAQCRSPWEMTQGAATWLAERCMAPLAAIYMSEDGPGQVRRGLHLPGRPVSSALTSLLPHRLWWQGPAAWTSAAGPSMRVVPFRLGDQSGVAVVGPFPLDPSREELARSIDSRVHSMVAPLVAGLERFGSRGRRTELLEAVAYQFGASLDGSPDPLLFVLRERMLARRVAWEDGQLVVEDAEVGAPAAVAAAQWWLPLVTGSAGDAPAVELVLLGLADLMDARHPVTTGRSLAAADLAIRLGARLGLDTAELKLAEQAACLHRVGAAVLGFDVDNPEAVTNYPRLGPVGAALLAGAGHDPAVVEAVRRLPERWDGAGPGAVSGPDIPAASRVVAVAAAWLAMNAGSGSELVARQAARSLVDGAGRRFDPRIVGALLEETDVPAAL